MYYQRALLQLSVPNSSKVFIFFTHFEPFKHDISNCDLAALFDDVSGILCMNTGAKNDLVRLGIDVKKCHVVIGAADPDTFTYQSRQKNGYIGLSQSFYNRKNPDLLLKLVELMPHRQFLLIGKDWHLYEHFLQLIQNENFHYIETSYENYSFWYKKMTVFLSVSHLEGGPIPLLETMMSNVVPVVSATGFAVDVVRHGINGFVFGKEANPEEISILIEQAFKLNTNVSETVVDYSWDNFTKEVHKVMNFKKDKE
jgi:glycosyltransferase involved in cell wall biosynthesis